MIETRIIEGLPPPNGHYSHCIIHNDTVYVSGILPGGLSKDAPLKDQADKVFNTIAQVLGDCGSSLDQVISCHIYIADLNDWTEINQLYSGYFGDHRPARVVVPVKELHFGYKLEVEVIAAVP